MKIIGGEYEYNTNTPYSYITDLGRSSLRLILKSLGSKKRFLLPDFLCGSITKIFAEQHINFKLYHINEDLAIDGDSLKNLDEYDVLYVIDYFGNRDNYLLKIDNKNLFIIEDACFLPILEKPENIKNWISFNSFRKISYIADGSIMKSTVKLDEKLIVNKEAPFVRLKYSGKNIKYEYIHKNLFSEDSYLEISEEAKQLINAQKEIFSVSKISLFNIFNFYKNMDIENKTRATNYMVLEEYLNRSSIKIDPVFYSFFVLLVEKRDELRDRLFKEKVFLPVHWPKTIESGNTLYDKIISIPVDSRYTIDDMKAIAEIINKFCNN